jgi:hypothetical protein
MKLKKITYFLLCWFFLIPINKVKQFTKKNPEILRFFKSKEEKTFFSGLKNPVACFRVLGLREGRRTAQSKRKIIQSDCRRKINREFK